MDNSSNKNRKLPASPSLDRVVANIQRDKEEALAQSHAQGLGLRYRNMSGVQPDPAAVALVPKDLANDARLFAFAKTGSEVELAIDQPDRAETLAGLKQLGAMDEYTFTPIFVSKSSMDYLLGVYDTFAPDQVAPQDIKIDLALQAEFTDLTNLTKLQAQLATPSTSQLLETILAGATALKASDIHIEPADTEIRLRYRLDGVLQDIASLPQETLHNLVDRIKILSKLKLNVKEASQDGRFSISAGDTKYDIRVSILPTQYGESGVLRLLPQTGHFVSLDDLGLSSRDRTIIDEAIRLPNGLILNTGPTGSGKTTTLYAVLNTVNSKTTKIITVEDPIEYRLAGITQTQVNEEEKYTFASALRAIVRQDPDIILVGEIRDPETAGIAINASLTGHLVFSTLHTNDAAGAIPRLIDLQADPSLFGDALRLIIAQRLVRKLCPSCRKLAAPTEIEISTIQKLQPDFPIPTQLGHPTGCEECNQTGYRGRLGIFELMQITPGLKALITKGATAEAIRSQAISDGMTTLAQDGLAKIANGTTSLEEFMRAVGDTKTD